MDVIEDNVEEEIFNKGGVLQFVWREFGSRAQEQFNVVPQLLEILGGPQL